MDNEHLAVPSSKRLKLDETVSVKASEASCLTEDYNGVVLVENSHATATLAIYLPHHNELIHINSLTPEMIVCGQSLLSVRGELYIFVHGGKLFRFDSAKFWTEMYSTDDYRDMPAFEMNGAFGTNEQPSDFAKLWVEMCPTKHYHDAPAVEMDGFVYVLGSTLQYRSTAVQEYSSCERYDPSMNTWTCVGYTVKPSSYCCYATLNGWIYCIGFKDEGLSEKGVERFNPGNGVWDDVASIKGIIRPISAATLHGKIYVLGDVDRQCWSSSIEFYNPNLDVWTVAVCTTLPVHHMGLLTMDQDLIVISQNQIAQGTCVKLGTIDLQDRCITYTRNFPNMSLDPQFFCAPFKVPRDYFVTIHVDGEVHTRSLAPLAKRNKYFRSMFSHGFLEDQTRIVTFTNVDSKALQLCIEQIETGSSSPLTLLSVAVIEKCLHCARMLLLDDFVKDLSRKCITLLSVETFEEIMRISYKYDLFDLEESCDLFATENFEKLTTQPYYLSMEPEYVKSMVKSVNKSAPQINNVLQAVVVWVEHDYGERKKYFGDLLSVIDIFRIELFHLMNAMKEPIFANNRSYKKLLDKGIRKRKQRRQVLLLKDADNDAFSVYSANRKKSTRIQREFHEDIKFCFTALDKLYVFDKACRLFCFPFTEPKAVWVEKPQLKLEGENMKYAVSGGCFFVFGKNGGARYNCDEDVWSFFRTYGRRENFAVVGYKEWIYFLGGKEVSRPRAMSTRMSSSSTTDTATIVLNSVVRFSTVSDEWCEDIPAMEKARYDATAVECCEKIYALGGKNERDYILRHCEQYDPLANIWTEIKTTKKLCFNFAVVVMNGKILLLSQSGESWRGPRMTISTYDQRYDIWRSKGSVDGKFLMESIVSVSLPYDLFA